jgi:IS5 family transposase
MAVTMRRVLTNVRRHARSLLPPSKDIRKTGRKGFRKHALVSALVLGFLRGIVTERGMERYLNEHRMEARLCDLQAKPSDTTLGRVKRWLAPRVLEQLLNRAIKETIKHLGKRRVCIAVDCSPLEAYRSKDQDASWGYSTTKGWFFGYKIHAAIDAVTGLPLAVIVTPGNRHGMNYLPLLLRKVRENGIRFRVVIADSGYDGEVNYRAIKGFGAIPVIKRNERNRKDGSTSKKDS